MGVANWEQDRKRLALTNPEAANWKAPDLATSETDYDIDSEGNYVFHDEEDEDAAAEEDKKQQAVVKEEMMQTQQDLMKHTRSSPPSESSASSQGDKNVWDITELFQRFKNWFR